MKVATTSTLGFPRMGPHRELKFALEKHWKGTLGKEGLLKVAQSVEAQGWDLQRKAGIQKITVGDHHLYDFVLATTELLGMVPKRFQHMQAGMERLFAMARGIDSAQALSKSDGSDW